MKNTVLLFLAMMVCFSSEVASQTLSGFFDEADALFGRYVSNGKVDYDALKKDPKPLESLMEMAATISVSEADKSAYQAFWINAYNLAVIKGVIDNYPLNSPLDVDGFFDRTTYKLGGKMLTLNDIENKMLRAKFNDARVHFVLVCGAKGCPPLTSTAYTPASVETKLQEQTIKALNDPQFIRVSEGNVSPVSYTHLTLPTILRV